MTSERYKPEYAEEAQELIKYLQLRGGTIGVIAAAARMDQNTIIQLMEGTHPRVMKTHVVDLHLARRRLQDQGFLNTGRAMWAFVLDGYLTHRFGEDYSADDAQALAHGLANRYNLNEDERQELKVILQLVKEQ